MAKPCHKQASPRHGFVFRALPTCKGYGGSFNWYGSPEDYAAALDCIYEMATDIVGANAITPTEAVALVMNDENWRALPTQVKAIIKRIEEES